MSLNVGATRPTQACALKRKVSDDVPMKNLAEGVKTVVATYQKAMTALSDVTAAYDRKVA